MELATNRVLGSNQLTFQSDGTPNPFKVPFEKPVEILPGCTYVISALLRVSFQ